MSENISTMDFVRGLCESAHKLIQVARIYNSLDNLAILEAANPKFNIHFVALLGILYEKYDIELVSDHVWHALCRYSKDHNNDLYDFLDNDTLDTGTAMWAEQCSNGDKLIAFMVASHLKVHEK